MTVQPPQDRRFARSRRRSPRIGAFTLVELLTVIFIISLLIGILIPSINSTRTAAKKLTTAKTLDAIKVGLEMFKNDNGNEFRQTNGYPPSWAHPPIRGTSGPTFDPIQGQFPFRPFATPTVPRVYGAHWLPAMLMGADFQGYVKRSTVPKEGNLRQEPWRWYQSDPLGTFRPLQRMPLYLDPSAVRSVKTEDLPGQPSSTGGSGLFPDWLGDPDNAQRMETMPVLVDAFDQPILYYVAHTHGRSTNMLEDVRVANNVYTGGIQQEGPPYYFHQDNEGFTGRGAGTDADAGWNFGGATLRGEERLHPISQSGSDKTPEELLMPENANSFAAYILDRQIARDLAVGASAGIQYALKPVNPDSYLLITAGPDGRFGTNDDVTNLPPKKD